MKIYTVIPNWNGVDMLEKCINSLLAQTIDHKIIVVDNNSSDASVELLKSNYKNKITILVNDHNKGFAGGVNTGIDYALQKGADAVALFNNDAYADKNWLKQLSDTMSQKNSGIVTCKFMRIDKKHLDSTGDFYSVYGIPFPRGRNQVDKKQFDSDTNVFAASGGASLYSAEMLRKIGTFDERFFAYYEDVDISFRAHLVGYKVLYEPKALAYHHVGGTSSKMGNLARYHSIKNFLILYTKNMPTRLYIKYLPKFLYQLLRTSARSILDLQFHLLVKAFVVFLFLLPSILIDRHKIQKGRKISASKIDSLLYKKRPPKPIVLDQ